MRCLLTVSACLLALAVPALAEPNLPPNVSLPALRSQIPAGGGTAVAQANRHDGPRTVDGDPGDWGGTLPGFGGASAYSSGELVYEDHLFDAYGADEGQDAQRAAFHDDLVGAVPELYRVDGTFLQYAPGELGVPTGPFISRTEHGGLDLVEQADLSEVRLGTDDGGDLWLLARTTTMTAPASTALLVLLDTTPGDTQRSVPFGSGLTTTKGDVAVLITPAGGRVADLATGTITDLPAGAVAYDPSGYRNTVEARLPRRAAGRQRDARRRRGRRPRRRRPARPPRRRRAATRRASTSPTSPSAPASPPASGGTAARRSSSTPARWTPSSPPPTSAGWPPAPTSATSPAPGYHERIFTSTPEISAERKDEGLLQRYGVYLPEGYDASRPTPTQFWLHFRGGTAHVAAHVVPGVFWDMGEREHSIVITPHGRGTSGWYVGKSGVDIEQVWKDSHERFAIDRDRTYVAGHSMGGFGSWLLPVMHPDWFAGSFPASPPPTQGAWTGLDARRRSATATSTTSTRRASSRPTAATPARSSPTRCSTTCARSRTRSTTAPTTSSSPSAA